MSDFIISSEQLERLIVAIEHNTNREINRLVIDGDRMPEIVRCRDCVYMHTVRSWLGMDVDECWLHADHESGALGKNRTEPDGFCAWACRKSE